MNQIEKQEKSPLVSIITLAYNHENYIRDCLEGILMQKTSFKFELIIHDDASTDNTANIIREYEKEYSDIVKPIYQKENQYSKGVPIGRRFLYPRTKGIYVAECEGDDYWIDPLKLQKQVDILESDSKVSFVYSNFKLVDFNNTPVKSNLTVLNQISRSRSGYLLSSLLHNNFPQTLTVMYRRKLLDNFDKYYGLGYDWPFFIHICGKCKSVYLKEVTGCYRINSNGIMASGMLKTMDDGGFKTLSGAFNAYLSGEYTAISIWDKLKINLYMYYRLSKGDIENYAELEKSIKGRMLYQVVKRTSFIWSLFLRKK